jgi:hypothetical protein
MHVNLMIKKERKVFKCIREFLYFKKSIHTMIWMLDLALHCRCHSVNWLYCRTFLSTKPHLCVRITVQGPEKHLITYALVVLDVEDLG